MRIDIVTCCPGLLQGPFDHSIVKRGIDKGLVEVVIHDLRDYGVGKYRQVDDYPYGGGGGMVLMLAPIVRCLETLQRERVYDEVIYLAPDGEVFNQGMANALSMKRCLLFLCGHYKGVDERVRCGFVTREISMGNFVVSGGEAVLPGLVDSVVRLIPGVLSNGMSALSDSFQDGLVAPPVYTRPAVFRGMEVPAVLLSGHAENIAGWRDEEALRRTRDRRPDFLSKDHA